uniref:Cytohesin Ubiquitin Protein Inducing domain-containing protein n=1 Tax=Xiphophorus maculatus TaxID=8083 RepID=A0A3B5PTL6_XIPMA
MLNQRPHSSNGEMRSQHGAWRAGQNLQGWIENRTPPIELQREIQRLGSLLEKERARCLKKQQKLKRNKKICEIHN